MPSVRLGDVLEVQSGFAFKTEYFTSDAGIPLIRIRDLPNTSTEINYRGEYREEFIVKQGEYLIGMDGNFRCFRWQGPRALLNQRVCRLRNFNGSADPEYVYYGIAKKLREIEDTTSFMTVKHISAKQVQNIELPLPSLAEQHRIVDLLSRAEGIVRLRREAQKKAAELIPALFLEMFGDPATNPKGWPVSRFGDVCKQVRVSVKPGERSDLKYVGLETIEAGSGRFIDGEMSKTPESPQANSFQFSSEHVLYGKLRPYLNKVALPSFEGKCSTEIIPLLPGNKINRQYLASILRSGTVVDQISSRTAGARMPRADMDFIFSMEIPIPPRGMQDWLAERLAEIQAIQSQQSAATGKAQATFDALLAQVFQNQL